MTLTTGNGTVLDSEELAAPTLNQQIKRYQLPLLAFVATFPNGFKEYAILELEDEGETKPVYNSTSLEAASCWIDFYRFSILEEG
jgi:hypothetical protein